MKIYTTIDVLRRYGTTPYAHEPSVVFEGPAAPLEGGDCESLDEAVSALDWRYAEIDEQAIELARQLETADGGCVHAEVGALKLRYEFVRLLRVVRYLDVRSAAHEFAGIRLVARRFADAGYARLLAAYCQARGKRLEIDWTGAESPGVSGLPRNAWWRRVIGGRAAYVEPAWVRPGELGDGKVLSRSDASKAIVLCGNRAHLDGLCEELVRRGRRVAWFFDRFSVGCWRRWRRHGVGQFFARRRDARFEDAHVVGEIPEVTYRGVDLTPAVRVWIEQRERERGPYERMIAQRAGELLEQVQPAQVVVDEDATPVPRILLAAARARGIRSSVVQHGVPCVRFGFAPLLADRILVWGESSRRQLISWGIREEKIAVTGCSRPWYRRMAPQVRSSKKGLSNTTTEGRPSRRVLLLATVPPRDERPDAVAMQLNSATYVEMLHWVAEAVQAFQNAELIVKAHPRTIDVGILETAFREHAGLRAEIVREAQLCDLLQNVDCAISCVSSAGVEAAFAGIPTVQLIPSGAVELLPANAWGMMGTARSAKELKGLLEAALGGGTGDEEPTHLARERILAADGKAGSQRIADALLWPEVGATGDGRWADVVERRRPESRASTLVSDSESDREPVASAGCK